MPVLNAVCVCVSCPSINIDHYLRQCVKNCTPGQLFEYLLHLLNLTQRHRQAILGILPAPHNRNEAHVSLLIESPSNLDLKTPAQTIRIS